MPLFDEDDDDIIVVLILDWVVSAVPSFSLKIILAILSLSSAIGATSSFIGFVEN